MNLYTIIFDYRGGTYISQVEAEDENQALILWGQNINPEEIQFLGKKLKEKLNKEIHEMLYEIESGPTPINGVKNCWCAGIFLSGLVDIIKTAKK
jgi:hypothetical protein